MWPLDVLHDPAWQPLTCTLLHFLWQGAIVAATWTLLFRLSRARTMQFRYALGLAGMFVMAACPVATFALLQSQAGAAEANASFRKSSSAGKAPRLQSGGVEERKGIPGDRNRSSIAPRVARDLHGTPGAVPCDPAVWIGKAQPYLLGGWMLGLVVLSGRLMFGVVAARRLGRGRLPIAGELAERMNALAVRLGFRAVPKVFSTKAAREAVVTGLLRPIVLLPAVWLAGMPPDVLEAVIAHELAHIRRHDVWFNLFQRFVETLLFYHPAVWWLSRRVRLAREMCCDEMAARATGERVVYATALELAARKRLEPAGRSLLEVALGITRMTLLDRVRNVLGLAARHEQGRWWPAAVMVLLVLPAVWFASLAVTAADEKPIAVQPAKNESGAERLVLDVDAEGKVSAARPINDIDEFLAAKAREVVSAHRMTPADLGAGKELPTIVVVRVSRSAPFGKLDGLIKTCQRHGFRQFAFAVRKEEPSLGSPVPASEKRAARAFATAFLRVAMDETPTTGGNAPQAYQDRFEIYKNTQAELLRSRLVLRAALRNPRLAKLPWIQEKKDGGEGADWLAQRLQISFPGKAEIMKVSLGTAGSVDAAVLLNAVVEAYLKEVVHAERERKQRRYDELDRICGEKEQEIRNKREELKRLVASVGGAASSETRAVEEKIALEQLAAYRAELAKTNSELGRYQVDLAVQNAYLEDAKGDARAPILKEIKRLKISIDVTKGQIAKLLEQVGLIVKEAKHFGQESVDIEMTQAKLRNMDHVLANFIAEREALGVEMRATPRITLLEPAE